MRREKDDDCRFEVLALILRDGVRSHKDGRQGATMEIVRKKEASWYSIMYL